MQLKVKFLKWSAGIPVAMLNKETADEIGVHTGERISIKTLSKNPEETYTIIDIVEGLVKKNNIAFSSELKKRFNIKSGQEVDVNLGVSPKSLFYIQKKLKKRILTRKEIFTIIEDIVNNFLSEPEIALFISAMYRNGMNKKETVALIEAILDSGNHIKLKNKYVVDKHSIGGVAGNRTTPVVVSICAAAGLTMPKNSSRAITSAAGTADVIETVCKVEFSIKELKKIIKKTNACMVWGGSLGLVPADSKILKVEKQVKLDPDAQLLASIMSKKLSVGSKYIIIDIPYGKGAKVDKERALRLKRKFEDLGRYFNKKLRVVLTDGTQPIGNGIGPVMELFDVIKVLDPKQKGPEDLTNKSLFLSGTLLELTGKVKKGQGVKEAKRILESGEAFKKFKEIIKAQKGKINGLKYGKYKEDIIIKKTGTIKEINNKLINSLAIVAGCPVDKSAGVYLYRHVGDRIKRGEVIITIYSESEFRLKDAINFYKKNKPIKIK
jgi:AMP phosphorylase